MRVFESVEELKACVGQEVGTSPWVPITQERIDRFAQATDDHQWIHVDPDRAVGGPFGTTVAHGFLTLSLLPLFFETTIEVKKARMGINYGLNRVRFTSPVPVGSELRGRLKLVSVEDVTGNGVQMIWQVEIERKGSDKPVCIAESITRRYF